MDTKPGTIARVLGPDVEAAVRCGWDPELVRLGWLLTIGIEIGEVKKKDNKESSVGKESCFFFPRTGTGT